MPANRKPIDLRQACVAEAFRIIEESGLQALSLRDVARRLNVSHQAPYKHFPSRDHIVAAVIARIFDEFAAYLDGRPACADAQQDLHAMGEHYLEYARLNPLKYRLMFNTPLPEPKLHPEMMNNAKRAFALLTGRLASAPVQPAAQGDAAPARLDAMFVWSTLHGLASIMQSDALHTLDMEDEEHKCVAPNAMARMGLALFGKESG